MKNLKTVLTIVSLLVIGFTAGFYTNRALVKSHIKKVGEIGGGPRLQDHIYNAIGATDEQKEVLGPLIMNHGRELASLMKETRSSRKEIMDKLFTAIQAEINPEQQNQLGEFRKRYLKRRRPEKGGRGEFQRKREKRSKGEGMGKNSSEE